MTMTTTQVDLLQSLGRTTLAFTVSGFRLKSVLKDIAPAKPRWTDKNAMPVLHGVRIIALGGHVRLTITDLDLTASTFVPGVHVEHEGIMVLPIKQLTDALKGVQARKDCDVTIAADANGDATVTMGGTSLKLPGLPVDEYPRLTATPGAFSIDRTLFGAVVTAVSGNDARPILNTVRFAKGQLAATDSYRLHVIDHELDVNDYGVYSQGAGARDEVLIPSKVLNLACRQSTDPRMWVGEREVTFTFDDHRGLQYTQRLCEGEFPKYQGLIPAKTPARIELGREDLIAACKTAIAFIGKEPNTPMRITVEHLGSSAELHVSVQDVGKTSQTVDAYAEVPGVAGGDTFTVAFNPEYLLGAIVDLDVPTVVLRGTDAQKPWVISDHHRGDHEERQRLLMPVRVS